jgi:hypothetical protein
MDRREAFRAAVIAIESPEWTPAHPDRPTFEVNGDYLTIAQVCDFVKDIPDELPDEVLGRLLKAMHSDPALAQLVGQFRTYTMGAQCLSRLLAARVALAERRY